MENEEAHGGRLVRKGRAVLPASSVRQEMRCVPYTRHFLSTSISRSESSLSGANLPFPGGKTYSSRWLSAATPPESVSKNIRIPEGCQTARRLASRPAPGCHPIRDGRGVFRGCRCAQSPATRCEASGFQHAKAHGPGYSNSFSKMIGIYLENRAIFTSI